MSIVFVNQNTKFMSNVLDDTGRLSPIHRFVFQIVVNVQMYMFIVILKMVFVCNSPELDFPRFIEAEK